MRRLLMLLLLTTACGQPPQAPPVPSPAPPPPPAATQSPLPPPGTGALPAPDSLTWTVKFGEVAGEPTLIRLCTGAKAVERRPELPIRFAVAVPLQQPAQGGVPDAAEARDLQALEDRLAPAVEAKQQGYLVAVLTNSRSREFVFYVRDEAKARKAVAALKDPRLRVYSMRDPEWTIYRELYGSSSS